MSKRRELEERKRQQERKQTIQIAAIIGVVAVVVIGGAILLSAASGGGNQANPSLPPARASSKTIPPNAETNGRAWGPKDAPITIVEYLDYQCPACRRFHGTLKAGLKSYGDRVHFVRLNKPLASHFYARDAARAAVCAEAQSKLEPMADALFAAPDLSPGGIDRVAPARADAQCALRRAGSP